MRLRVSLNELIAQKEEFKMVYSNGCVVCILVDGQVIKENPDGSVAIPFGCEYTIRLRNKNDRNCAVQVSIDGESQTKGGWIIPPKSYRDFERSSHSPRKFKLVESTSTEAQDHGKDTNNSEGYNGVLEAKFFFEKEKPKTQEVHHHYHHYPRPGYRRPTRPYDDIGSIYKLDCTSTSDINFSGQQGLEGGLANEMAPSAKMSSFRFGSESETRPGVTVEGGYSNQTFGTMYLDLEDTSTIVRLVLKGYVDKHAVEACEVGQANSSKQPAKKKGSYCHNCGAKQARRVNFCANCGSKQ